MLESTKLLNTLSDLLSSSNHEQLTLLKDRTLSNEVLCVFCAINKIPFQNNAKLS